MQPHNAVVLGASGLVGQRMQQRLANHPWFRLAAVVGSQRTAGKTLDIVEKITEKLLKVSLDFENGKPKTLAAKKIVRSKS